MWFPLDLRSHDELSQSPQGGMFCVCLCRLKQKMIQEIPVTYLQMIQEGDGEGGGEYKERKEQNDKANVGNDLSVTLWT